MPNDNWIMAAIEEAAYKRAANKLAEDVRSNGLKIHGLSHAQIGWLIAHYEHATGKTAADINPAQPVNLPQVSNFGE